MQRIVFIGVNSAFSTAHLTALGRTYRIEAIVETLVPLSRLKRLERWLAPSSLKVMARDLDATFTEVAHKDHAALERVLRAARPDLVVVVGMGWLLNEAALAVPPLGTINVHPALLPAYRGGEPLFWQLYDCVELSGVTVHLVDAAEDRGPILCQRSFPVRLEAGTADFAARILEVGPAALLEAAEGVLDGTIQPVPQPQASPTRRARRLRPADRNLIAWDEWSLERTWQVLRRVGPVLNWPKTRWRDLGRIPVIQAMVPGPPGLPAGDEGRDADGWFLAHPDGKIHFHRQWAPRAWLRAIRRGAAPGHVTIASLQASGSSVTNN